MNALQAKIAAADTEMLLITAANLQNMKLTTAAEFMTEAEVLEELVRRCPETAAPVEAWIADYESEMTMLEVILANINEMPQAA